MFGVSSNDRVLHNIVGRGSIYHLCESNVKILGRDNVEEVSVLYNGDFEGKGEKVENWHILPVVDITDSGIEVIRWLVIWIEVLVEKDIRLEG